MPIGASTIRGHYNNGAEEAILQMAERFMLSETGQIEPQKEATEARFSMRMLLGAMTVAAFWAAAGGVFLRHSPAASHQRLLTFWGAWLAALIAYAVVAFQQRMRAEQDAGLTILTLRIRDDISPSAAFIGRTIIVAAMLLTEWIFASYLIVSLSASTAASGGITFYLLPVMFVASSMTSLSRLMWQVSVRFCENGILWERTMLPWSEVFDCKWTSDSCGKLEIYQIDSEHSRPWVSIRIAPDHRANLQELIDKKLKEPRLPAMARKVGVGQVPLGALFRQPHLRKHLFPLALSLACGLYFTFLLMTDSSGSREFDQGQMIAIYLWAFTRPVQLGWFLKNSGPPRARVFARRDFAGFVLIAATAVSIRYATALYIWSWALADYIAGFVYVYLVLSTLTYFFITQLDLRDEAVVMPGAFRWPWTSVQVRRWDRENGRLVLSRGWRRVVATVLPDQRAAVADMLREKLGYVDAETKQSVGSSC